MATLQLVQERLISGQGILRLPEENKKLRYAILYLDVIRDPRNQYINNNWYPKRSKYAFLTFIKNGYVQSYAPMEWEQQSYPTIADIAGQNLIALKCAYEGILITFFNLGNALGLPSVSYTDLIKDYENLNLMWDEVRIKCYSSTAIQARLYKLSYDTCDPEKDDQFEPPPPPPRLPKVPVNEPINSISPPYNNEPPNDGTDPYEGDEFERIPKLLRVLVRANANGTVPAGGTAWVEGVVPDDSYTPELRPLDPPPGVCATIPGIAVPNPPLQTTVAIGSDGGLVRIFTHNTCNLMQILDYEFVDVPPPTP